MRFNFRERSYVGYKNLNGSEVEGWLCKVKNISVSILIFRKESEL